MYNSRFAMAASPPHPVLGANYLLVKAISCHKRLVPDNCKQQPSCRPCLLSMDKWWQVLAWVGGLYSRSNSLMHIENRGLVSILTHDYLGPIVSIMYAPIHTIGIERNALISFCTLPLGKMLDSQAWIRFQVSDVIYSYRCLVVFLIIPS